MRKKNRIFPESHSIDLDTAQTSVTTQSRYSCEDFRRKKIIWIIIIIAIIIILAIIVTTIILTRKKNLEETSMLETTSITTEMSITTEITTESLETTTSDQVVFPINARWKQNGVTIAGGHKNGNGLNQLNEPYGIYVDDDERAVYIADTMNNRVVQWKFRATSG
ncbi:unnamed protein product, partial [Adineta steineri]